MMSNFSWGILSKYLSELRDFGMESRPFSDTVPHQNTVPLPIFTGFRLRATSIGWGARDNENSLLRSSINHPGLSRLQARHSVHLPQHWIGWGAGDNKKSLLRSSINHQNYLDLQHSILFTSSSIGLDGELETIKRVCCEAALTPGLLLPQHSIWFTSPRIGLDGEPETIKRVCCEAALTPRTIITPAQHLGYLTYDWIGWGAGDNKMIML